MGKTYLVFFKGGAKAKIISEKHLTKPTTWTGFFSDTEYQIESIGKTKTPVGKIELKKDHYICATKKGNRTPSLEYFGPIINICELISSGNDLHDKMLILKDGRIVSGDAVEAVYKDAA